MKKLLLVDADPLSRCVLDVSLRKLGFNVTTANDGADALAKIDTLPFDLVLTDTRLPELDGIALVRRLKERSHLSELPVMFLASVESIEDRKRALELGVGDYLAKPIFLSELAARINLLLAKRTRERMRSKSSWSRFGGSTHDLALVDLLQNFEQSRTSGAVHLRSGAEEARLYFRDGRVIDAELGPMRGEEVVYRALIWNDASFDIDFHEVSKEDVIGCSTQDLILRGMQRVDDWVRLIEQVRPLASLLDIHPPQLLERLSRVADLPEGLDAMLRLPPGATPRALAVSNPPRDSARPSVVPVAPTVVTAWAASVSAIPASSVMTASFESSPAPPPAAPAPDVADGLISSSFPAARAVPEGPASASSAAPPSAPVPSARPSVSFRPEAPSPFVMVAPKAPAPVSVTQQSAAVPAVLAASVAAAQRPSPPTPAVATPAKADAPTAIPATAAVTEALADATTIPIRPRTVSQRPSAAPWTREIGSREAHAEAEDVAAGVPRAMGTMTKWVVGASFAVAALVLVAVGLNSVRERQQREAEAVRSGGGEGPTAPAAAGSPTAIGPPAAPIATASAAAPVAEHAAPAEAAVGANPPSTEGAGATAGQAAAPGVDPSGLAQATAAALAGIGASPGRESALDSKVALSSRSPRVRDAERALLKGETDRAVVLAQQAVGEDPVDADAWLTLAAARKASGDVSGAREAYHLCIAQAQGADVTDCRILGRSLDNH